MTKELLNVVVTAREEQGVGIAVFELSSQSGGALPEFSAGAHIDVHVSSDLVRQYSLCNKPGVNKHYRIGVLSEPKSRGGSSQIYQDFNIGKVIKISEPRNLFELDDKAECSLLIAGGIGITPLIAMAYELESKGKAFQLHYCMRSRGVGAFVEELEEQFPGKVVCHYDDEDEAQLFSPEETFQHQDVATHIYVCGPSGFMDWVINAATSANYPNQQIHFEYFNKTVDVSGMDFEVHCAKSDVTVNVGEQQTIVQALSAAGIKVDVSCEQGICGTCITDVLEGEPEHRDQFLTDEEKEDNDQIALCCSRAKNKRLVIDL